MALRDKIDMFNFARTRQIILYRATTTIRRAQIKQYTTSKEEGATKPIGISYNFDKVWSGAVPDGSFGKESLIRDANKHLLR